MHIVGKLFPVCLLAGVGVEGLRLRAAKDGERYLKDGAGFPGSGSGSLPQTHDSELTEGDDTDIYLNASRRGA